MLTLLLNLALLSPQAHADVAVDRPTQEAIRVLEQRVRVDEQVGARLESQAPEPTGGPKVADWVRLAGAEEAAMQVTLSKPDPMITFGNPWTAALRESHYVRVMQLLARRPALDDGLRDALARGPAKGPQAIQVQEMLKDKLAKESAACRKELEDLKKLSATIAQDEIRESMKVYAEQKMDFERADIKLADVGSGSYDLTGLVPSVSNHARADK